MREKIGALIQFLAVIAAVALLFWGICGGYQEYFGSEVVNYAKFSLRLIAAVIGAGVGIGGVIIGSLLKK